MSLISSILPVFRRELREVVKDSLYLSSLLLLPLLMVLFFVAMFSGGAIRGLPIALVDRDNSDMSRRLATMVNATRGVDIAYNVLSVDEAEKLMLSGDVVAILYIDDGFEADIFRGVPTKAECYISGASISASGVVESDVQLAVRTFSEGTALNKLQLMGESYAQAMIDIMPINFHAYIVSNPYLNYGYYLAPIFMFMGIVIFTMLTSIFAIGRELRYSTAPQWLDSASGSMGAAIIGKLLPTTIVMVLFMQFIFFLLFVVMGMDCQGSYLILLLGSILFILAYQSVAVFIVSFTANLRLALSLGGGYSVMAFTFSGITFPVMSMYGVAQIISKLFPLTYFSDLFVDQAMRGVTVGRNIPELLIMLSFTLLIPLSWRRIRRVTTDVNYYGRD